MKSVKTMTMYNISIMKNDTRDKLLKAVRVKAYRTGDFTLASGKKSDYYIDCKEVTLDGDGSLLVGKIVFEIIKSWGVSAVGGMELGSVPISTAVSVISALEGAPLFNFIVRKEAKGHGTGKRLEGRVGPGDRVAVVEDVVSTGGSSLKAIDAIEETGAIVAGLVSIVDREMGGAEAFINRGIKYTPIFTISEIRAS
ncbi:Orotate phosphoribosyltransferase [hydrothermal vent metagenome]|uniref:orotate phosphoribosyltransferase n=1 Tax=hydrothermal vent metagenome TaxID=652676 RepID=A0A3B1BQW1_9ZZZZ